MSIRGSILVWLVLLLCSVTASAQTLPTATVLTTTGTVFVQRADGALRTLSQGSTLEVGALVTTQANSSARIKFSDGSDTTLSANSRVRLDSYRFVASEPQSNNFAMSLLKGGLRSVTGLIGRRGNGNAHVLNTPGGKINASAAEYIARACEADCEKEVKLSGTAGKAGQVMASEIPARVAVLAGQAVAISKLGVSRALAVGAPLYVGEIIETRANSHAVLAFIDEGKITLQPLTRLLVQRFSYEPGKERQGQAVLYYLKGGLRVLTGLLGNRAPQNYKIQTGVALIGIRGTGFDTWCGGSCERERDPVNEPKRPPTDDARNGLFVNTWQGEVEVKNAAGVRVIGVGQTAHVSSADSAPQFVPAMPGFFLQLPGPRPDGVKVDMQQLFGLGAEHPASAGLHVVVKEGAVILDQQSTQVEIRTGETAYVSETNAEFYMLRYPQPFLENDVFLTTAAASGGICGFGY